MSQTAVYGHLAHRRFGNRRPQWPTGTGLSSLAAMEQTAVATDQTDTTQTDISQIEVAPTEALLDDELLVEEISIDGMCGVY